MLNCRGCRCSSRPLAPRRGRILKHVIEEYVVTAQPVSSDALVRKYVPAVSSATVRNEMAALEDYGYLYHPHTSAGRVPSDMGYRYYVEWLMGDARLSEMEERTISHQFHQVELEVGEWLTLAASLLASRVQTPVVIATADRPGEPAPPDRSRPNRFGRISPRRHAHVRRGAAASDSYVGGSRTGCFDARGRRVDRAARAGNLHLRYDGLRGGAPISTS